MALSGEFKIGSGVSWLWLYVKWTATQNTSGNYSNVKTDVYIQRSGGASAYNLTSNNLFINIEGSGGTYPVGFDLRNQTSQFLASRTSQVNHNSDGTKTFSIGVNYPTGIAAGTINSTQSFTLNPLQRAYGFNISSDNLNMDADFTVKVVSGGGAFTARMYYAFGNKKLLINGAMPLDTNYTFQFQSKDWADQIPNSTTGYGNVIVETWSGATKIGETSKKVTLNLPTSVTPSASVSQTELNNTIKTVTGSNTLYIANLSQIQLTTTANGIYGSTVKEYNVSVGGLSFTSTSNVQTIDLSQYNIGTGAIKATITVTDSRGRKASIDVTLNVQAYSPPTLKNFKVTRNMDLNTTINIVKTVAVSSIKNGTTEKNTYTIVTKYKKTVDTAWITAKTETNTSANFALTGMAIESSYDVQVTITDKLSTPVTVQSSVPSIFMIMSWSATTVGIGKAAEQGVLDIAGKLSDIYVGGISLLDLHYPIGEIKTTTNSQNPSATIGGTWERYGKGRVPVSVDESDDTLSAAGKTGGSINPLTSHNHKLTGSTYRTGTSGSGNTLGRSQDLGSIVTGDVGGMTITTAGDNTNHNNWQPYITIYLWRRIA